MIEYYRIGRNALVYGPNREAKTTKWELVNGRTFTTLDKAIKYLSELRESDIDAIHCVLECHMTPEIKACWTPEEGIVGHPADLPGGLVEAGDMLKGVKSAMSSSLSVMLLGGK